MACDSVSLKTVLTASKSHREEFNAVPSSKTAMVPGVYDS
jgi:hypothetical protein